MQDLLEVVGRVAEGAVIRLGERQGDAVVLAGLQRVGMIRSLSVFAVIQQAPQKGNRAFELPSGDECLQLRVSRVEGFGMAFA